MNRSDKKNLLIISIIFIILIFFMFTKYYNGMDNSYFNKIDNINIFNIGYENIYYYIYLGLYNITTFILIFIPFINTKYLLICFNIINVFLGIILFYKLLKTYKFNNNICLYGSILFMIFTPYLTNIFNEVIYTNYLPFFMLGLISISKYSKKNNKLLIFSIVMVALTNYKYLFLTSIIFVLYYLYNNKFNRKEFTYFIKLILLCLISVSFIYLPIILYKYSGFIFHYDINTSIIILISIVSLYFTKNKKNIYLFFALSFSIILNIMFNFDISLLFTIYLLSICVLFENISNDKIKKETIYKLFIVLILLIILFDKTNSNYIDYLFSLVIFIFISNDNKTSLLLMILYFIIYSSACYSGKYINDIKRYNYINYNDFNTKSFNKYSFPYKNELLMNYVIINDSNNYDYNSILKKYYINNSDIIYVSKEIKHDNNKYLGKGRIVINTSLIKNKVLIIRSTDNIKINNNSLMNNEYTFLNKSDTLEINISDKFDFNNFECFYMNNIVFNKVQDKKINVNLDKDGYIITKYKYDKFFHIKVDGKKTPYYKVNNDLVGIKIKSGRHIIKISYFSYYKLLSFIVSIIIVIVYKYLFIKKY